MVNVISPDSSLGMTKHWLLKIWLLSLMTSTVLAEYYIVPLGEVKFTGETKEKLSKLLERRQRWDSVRGRGVLPLLTRSDRGEIWLAPPEIEDGVKNAFLANSGSRLVLEAKPAAKVEGWLALAGPRRAGQGNASYTIDLTKQTAVSKAEFEVARTAAQRYLAGLGTPGAGFFAHLSGGEEKGGRQVRTPRTDGLEKSLELWGGHRAMASNLALNRELSLSGKEGPSVPLSKIEGITVPEVDWKTFAEGVDLEAVAIDPLAKLLPAEQHAVFFDNFKEVFQMVDALENGAVPMLNLAGSRFGVKGLADAYLNELGMRGLRKAAELLPVSSVAITGSDPYLPSGTTLSVLIETADPEALMTVLASIVEQTAGSKADKTSGKEGDVKFKSWINAKAGVKATLAQLDGAVLLTNSQTQVAVMSAVQADTVPALSSLNGYRFCRQQTPRAKDEAGFLFISDPTIRRWGGARSRIGQSRRIRALATLIDLQSAQISGKKSQFDSSAFLGKVEVIDGTVVSSIYGSVQKQTPIAELDLETVTQEEADAYKQWRRGYENGWQVFDPIALQARKKADQVSFDLSVIPLAIGNDYEEFAELMGEATINSALTQQPGQQALQINWSLDTESKMFRRASDSAGMFMEKVAGGPLGWMDGQIRVRVHEDKYLDFLQALLAAKPHATPDFKHFLRLPMVVRVGSKSGLRLGLFMTAARKFIQEAAGDSITIEATELDGHKVLELSFEERRWQAKVWLAVTKSALFLGVDRASLVAELDAESESGKTGTLEMVERPQIAASIDLARAGVVGKLLGDSSRTSFRSWQALPILNEWRRRFPDRDPIEVHQEVTGERLRCPSGGNYVLDKKRGIMVSEVFGLPGDEPSKLKNPLNSFPFSHLAFSVNLERNSLWLRTDLLRQKRVEKSVGTPNFSAFAPYFSQPVGSKWTYLHVDPEGKESTMVETLTERTEQDGKEVLRFDVEYFENGEPQPERGEWHYVSSDNLMVESGWQSPEEVEKVVYQSPVHLLRFAKQPYSTFSKAFAGRIEDRTFVQTHNEIEFYETRATGRSNLPTMDGANDASESITTSWTFTTPIKAGVRDYDWEEVSRTKLHESPALGVVFSESVYSDGLKDTLKLIEFEKGNGKVSR